MYRDYLTSELPSPSPSHFPIFLFSSVLPCELTSNTTAIECSLQPGWMEFGCTRACVRACVLVPISPSPSPSPSPSLPCHAMPIPVITTMNPIPVITTTNPQPRTPPLFLHRRGGVVCCWLCAGDFCSVT